MIISPAAVTVNLATSLTTEALTAAAAHSTHLARRAVSRKATRNRLRRIDDLIGAFPGDAEPQLRDYLTSRAGRKIMTSLAYLAMLDEVGGRRVDDLGSLFIQDVEQSCPDVDTARARRLWTYWTNTFRLTLAQLRAAGLIAPRDIKTATLLFGDFRKDKSTGDLIPVLPNSFMRRAALNADQERIEIVYGAIDAIRARVAESRKYIELPHLREQHLVAMDDLYVQRDLITAYHSGVDADNLELPIHEPSPYSVALPSRVVILGNPGVGKSTYVSQLLYRIAISQDRSMTRIAPMLLNLRDYAVRQDNRSFAAGIAEYIEGEFKRS